MRRYEKLDEEQVDRVDDHDVGHVVGVGWGRMELEPGVEGVVLDVRFEGHDGGHRHELVILGPEDVEAIINEVREQAPTGLTH